MLSIAHGERCWFIVENWKDLRLLGGSWCTLRELSQCHLRRSTAHLNLPPLFQFPNFESEMCYGLVWSQTRNTNRHYRQIFDFTRHFTKQRSSFLADCRWRTKSVHSCTSNSTFILHRTFKTHYQTLWNKSEIIAGRSACTDSHSTKSAIAKSWMPKFWKLHQNLINLKNRRKVAFEVDYSSLRDPSIP